MIIFCGITEHHLTYVTLSTFFKSTVTVPSCQEDVCTNELGSRSIVVRQDTETRVCYYCYENGNCVPKMINKAFQAKIIGLFR